MRRGDDDECWHWIGNLDRDGYGLITTRDQRDRWCSARAHRVSFELANGPIPDGLVICHRCDNPPCVNPFHLFLGTHADNERDKVAKGRKPRGERSVNAKLTDADVRVIRDRYATGGITQRALAGEYGVRQGTVSFILGGVTWKHISKEGNGCRPGMT